MLGWVGSPCYILIVSHETNQNRGGIRGIVELEVLKAIERQLPPHIPVGSFFDLIVGTRFVHGTFLCSSSMS